MTDALYEAMQEITAHKAQIASLRAQLAEARAKNEGPRQAMRWINATPDPDYPARILCAYIDEGAKWSDNTLGLPPENPLCKAMNEATEKRNALLYEALVKLAKPSPAPDATAIVGACGDMGQSVACDDTCPPCVHKPAPDATALREALQRIAANYDPLDIRGHVTTLQAIARCALREEEE
jgi:hypothetical protein